ncbi:NTF2- export protein 2 [Gaertneriomyces sp. JEL0708]|nr:hypothetical protein BC832DRAFT_24700 [Gaertneriomyces semiglobifer]KAJ3187899.1 NTF2- export protein 2 [Gaertneriomyces sp. JEL0708]
MATNPAELIHITTRAADNFIATYYKLYDRQRHLLSQMYKDTSAVLWNGIAMTGLEKLQEFFLKLPATDHQIHSYDGQPVRERGQILVTVTGTVKFGDDKQAKSFSQNFILSPDSGNSQPGTYFVSSDHFRFV